MTAPPPARVLLAFNERVRYDDATPEGLARLESFASWEWLRCEGGTHHGANDDPAVIERVLSRAGEFDALIVCEGAPRVDDAILARSPRLRIIAEIEGDRFAHRLDLEAARRRGVRVVDTTHGTSYPVAEWALALTLIALRNAGEQFRHLIQHKEYRRPRGDFGFVRGELYGKKVGLIGCGHAGRRLVSFLTPFRCDVRVHDPYLPKELADGLGFLLTTLDHVMADSDAVVCLVPLTPLTRGMIGARELALLPPGSVFVNVSRGPVVDSTALIERLSRGDVVAALDVFDPEPIPADSPIKDLPNVFLSPHIAGVTAAAHPRNFQLAVEELERFFHGHETLYDLTSRTEAIRKGELP